LAAVADRARARSASSARPPRRPAAWWGAGAPPHELWPGVSLTFHPVYSAARSRWETDGGRFYFDAAAADRAVDFFPLYLRHHIGEYDGLPFVLREDQAKLLTRPIFGWLKADDGFRRFRKVFAFCVKGYGKSPWGAGTGIYLARCDHEPAAEVYAVAADRTNARTVHDNAKIMVEASPDLFDGCEILKDSIVWAATHATYKVISSEASANHGFRPHGVIFDEMHAQKNRDLFEALWKSMPKRRQPLMVIITHAGDDDEGICYEEYDLAKRVLTGQVPGVETILPVIFEMTPKDDYTDPVVWRRINPGHGTTVKHDAIAAECEEAKVEPRKRNDFLRYHGNRWTNQATAWIPIDWWDACEGPLDDAELVTLDCAAGLDLAQKWDLASLVVVFRKYLETPVALDVIAEEPTGALVTKTIALNYQLFARPYFWIPENTMTQHAKDDGVPYPLWAEQGLVTPTDGDIIDYTRIYTDITTKILPRYPRLKQGAIGYDPAFATDLSTKLRDLAGIPILEILQNYKMFSEPSQIVEALIKGKRVRHDGHRVLRWNWENVAVKTDDAGRIRPVKPKQASKRVDGAVALIMGDKALSLLPKQPVMDVLGEWI
jgi:phage terminase large subunit-like protein